MPDRIYLCFHFPDHVLTPQVGVFVAKIVPGGQSQRAGLRENDKILKINNKVGHVTDISLFVKCTSSIPGAVQC